MQERGTSSLSEIKVLAPFRRRDCGERPASSTLHSLLVLPEIYYQSSPGWKSVSEGAARSLPSLWAAPPPPNETRRINALPVLPPKSSGRQHTLTSMLRRGRIS